jgi:L-lactate dehydrogenase complex protein LldF
MGRASRDRLQNQEHTLTHLDRYLEEFECNATKRGAHVHWARDAAEHNEIVHSLLKAHGVEELIKSKSMLQEECGMTHYLENRGVSVVESDLGERIQQLDGQPPSHISVPRFIRPAKMWLASSHEPSVLTLIMTIHTS